MTEIDPFATQFDAAGSVAAELAASGFEDATEIGRGGFGVVYRCAQPLLDRIVALKVLTADLDEENRARFFREQKAAGRLTGHPNIVNVFQTSVTGSGRPFIVMPYYAQDSLETRIRQHGPLPLGEALRLGVKIAGALESAHRLGILHRDVKPGNILLTDYGEPALSDFGIAHFAGGFETGTGIVTGSPAFIAPEVVAGEPASAAADVYGLGSTLFATLTGHAAFERRSGERLVAQFLRVTSEPVPNPREFGIPDDVSGIIERAMSGNPRTRPSAEELGQLLRESQRRHGLPVDEMSLYSEPARAHSVPQATLAVQSTDENEYGNTSIPPTTDRTGGLPLDLTSFVDRRTELATAKNLLTTARLVTLTGIGGVGKTRLALRIAAKTQHSFADGVQLVELAELQEASLLPAVVARTLGIQDRSAKPVQEMVAEFLAQREMLLVLDNCEQVVGAAAQLSEFLLRGCPDVKILATSREPLGIGGESVLLVPPLPVPDPDNLPKGTPSNDAVRLFVDRGTAVIPGFELTEDNKEAIASICRKLDGLPLPIELAAARLRAMSPEQILQRLTERYALLTSGSRDAPSRQQTLRMCVDWSYDLCTPVEQAMWARLSVFSGGFELNAAEKICGQGMSATEVLDAVTFLADKSILIREVSGNTVRFRMLETLRDYGRQKAQESGEHEYTELRRRHRDWCESLAIAADTEWISPRQIELITTIAREKPNLREALEFCLSDSPEIGTRITAALFSYWLSRGALTEGRQWLDRFRDYRVGPPTIERARAIHTGTTLAALQGDLATAGNLVEEGRNLASHSSDPRVQAYIHHAEGYLALFNEDLAGSCVHFEKAAQLFAEQKNLHFQVTAMLTLGAVLELLNDTEQAAGYNERVLAITVEHGETVYRSYVLWTLAVAAWKTGDRDRASRLLKQALRLGRNINDRLNAAMCLQGLSWLAVDDKSPRRAAMLMGAAEAASRSVGGASVVVPSMAMFQDASERMARLSLGESTFNEIHDRGAALRFHDAVDYALGDERSNPRSSTTGPSTKPTKREIEVAALVADGLTNKEIAARLVISPRTAQGHVEHLLVKLGFTSRTQVAAWFAESKGDRSEPR
ncbi:protein kinase [Rhodococcus sp. NPDC056743]|uniref:protein kinase domain-containing protein n=1 Tax=Rhodococcus sp. NPDC056743 TaxID=3345934 RepID=UPI00366B2BE1